MEKMKLKISRVDDAKTPTGKDVYHAFIDGSTSYYSCWSARIKDYIGKEQEFDVEKKEMQGQNGPWYAYTIKLPPEAGKGFFTGGRGFGDPILTAKTMLMAYAKDLMVALITAKQVPQEGSILMINMLGFYDAMAKKIIPVALPAHAPAQKSADTLSAAKQAIIQQKCKLLNFKAKDLIDFGGAIGLEIKYDAPNDTALIGQLDDQSAQHLINSLQDALK